MKMDNRVTAEQAMAHGGAIQQCLNGALMSVQKKNGEWEPFTGSWEYFSFSSDFSYRTKMSPSAPAIVSPATTNETVGRDVPPHYAGKSFSFATIKAHGRVIEWFLRGGSIQYRSDEGERWGLATSGGYFEFIPTSQYRIAEEACKCAICSEKLDETAAFAKMAATCSEPLPVPPKTQAIKPPLGVMPEYIWVENRIAALRAAVSRQIMESPAESINWRAVANWSAEILERKEQLEGINRRPKAA